jgi:glycosyltransferase involved in cell wall biosynthesis
MKKNKVTVIIPTFNRADIIPRAINSIINQTYQNWELIIIDDGSTDNTKDIIKKFLKDKKVRYFYQDNGGVCSARNLGIRKATGEYIAFLDSDDEFLRRKIEKQVRKIKKNKADMVICNVLEYREDKKIKNRFNFKKSFWVKQEHIVNYKIPMSASFMFLKTKLAKKVLFDEKMPSSNDFDFVLRISQYCKILFIKERLTKNKKSLREKRISTNYQKKIKGFKIIIEKINQKKYYLDQEESTALKAKTYFNLGLFYTLPKNDINHNIKMAKLYLRKANKYNRSLSQKIKIKILSLALHCPLFLKILTISGKKIWKLGLIQN